MSVIAARAPLAEARKLTAFFRRDLLVAWSYRTAFFSDWLNIFLQMALFYFLGGVVDPAKLPTFGGRPTSYIEFVAIGIVVSSFVQLGLAQAVNALRNEQLMGTLESLLVTPTSPITIQLGSVMYDLAYVPVRTVLFLLLAAVVFDLAIVVGGLVIAVAVLVVLVPFVWGVGLMSAAWVITFRRGLGIVGIGAAALTGTAGAYFPVEVLPGWLEALARLNPITVALDAVRASLLAGAGWSSVAYELAFLLAAAAASLAAGNFAFHLALRRERRRGSLGLY